MTVSGNTPTLNYFNTVNVKDGLAIHYQANQREYIVFLCNVKRDSSLVLKTSGT